MSQKVTMKVEKNPVQQEGRGEVSRKIAHFSKRMPASNSVPAASEAPPFADGGASDVSGLL